MSVLCNKIVFPSLFSHHHRRCRRHRSLYPLFKHLTTSTKAVTNSEKPKATDPLQTLSSIQKEQISLYVGALLQWNQRMNLTAVTEESEVMTRHVEDSLALIPPLKRSYLSHGCSSSSSDGLKLIDVGSGAGLPGLIFAIACPSWKVTLLESMQKRCLFLEHIVGLAGLSNVEILRERAEEFLMVSGLSRIVDSSTNLAMSSIGARLLEPC